MNEFKYRGCQVTCGKHWGFCVWCPPWLVLTVPVPTVGTSPARQGVTSRIATRSCAWRPGLNRAPGVKCLRSPAGGSVLQNVVFSCDLLNRWRTPRSEDASFIQTHMTENKEETKLRGKCWNKWVKWILRVHPAIKPKLYANKHSSMSLLNAWISSSSLVLCWECSTTAEQQKPYSSPSPAQHKSPFSACTRCA